MPKAGGIHGDRYSAGNPCIMDKKTGTAINLSDYTKIFPGTSH